MVESNHKSHGRASQMGADATIEDFAVSCLLHQLAAVLAAGRFMAIQ